MSTARYAKLWQDVIGKIPLENEWECLKRMFIDGRKILWLGAT